MNPLALAYLERRLARLDRAALGRIIEELRENQAKLVPVLKEYERQRNARMRQDGPTGFVMNQKKGQTDG